MADQIGAGSERRLERRILESLRVDGVLCQHGHQSEDERKLSVLTAGEIEAHGPFADWFGFGDLGVIGAMIGPSLVAQKLPREDHILRSDWRSVGELPGGVEVEGHVAALGVGLDAPRNQSVKREWLVIAARHQTFDHVAANGRWSDPFHNEGIEAVEGAEHALHEAAALGCGGFRIRQVSKTLWPGRRTVHRYTVPHLAGGRRARAGRTQDKAN